MSVKMTRGQKWGVACATALVLVVTLLFSPIGNKLLIWGANKVVTGLNVSLSQGKILSSGRLDVDYQTEQLSINIRNLTIDLNWFDCATACFSLSGESLNIEVLAPDAAKVQSPATPQNDNLPKDDESNLSPPLHVAVKTLDFAKIQFTTAELSMIINKLHLQADWQQQQLNIAALRVQNVVIEQSEKRQPVAPAPLTKLPAIAPLDIAVPLNIDLDSAVIKSLELRQGEQSNRFENFGIKATLTPTRISWQDLTVGYRSYVVNAQGSLSKSVKWQISSSTVVTSGEQKLSLHTEGPLSGLSVIIDSQGRWAGNVESTVNFTKDNYPFSLQADIPAQSLAGQINAPFQDLFLHHTALTASGDADNYHVMLNTKAHTEKTGTVDTQFTVAGDLKQATITRASVSIDEAEAEFNGAVNWQDGLQATASGNLHKLPILLLLPDESAQLSGKFDLAFNARHEQWLLKVPNLSLYGQVQQKPIKADIRLELNEQLIGQVEQLDLAYGDSHIQLSGTLAEQLSLEGKVTMDHNSDVLLPLDLAMHGDLSISGKRDAPTIGLNAKLDTLSNHQLLLKNGLLDLSIDGSNHFLSDINLHAAKLVANDISLTDIVLDANGDVDNHQLNFASKGMVDSKIRLEGGWQNNQWQGLLHQVELHYKTAQQNQTLQATLVEPVQVVASAKQVSLSNHCWLVAQSEMCLQAEQQTQGNKHLGQGSVTFKQIQLADVNPWLKDKFSLSGLAKGQLQLAWQDGQLRHAIGDIQGQNITLLSRSAPNQPSLPIEKLSLNLTSDATQAKLDWQLDSSIIGKINGDLQSPIGEAQSVKIAANVGIEKMPLAPIAPLLSQVLDQPIALNGDVSGKVALDDLSQATQLNGNITVTDFSIATASMPIALKKSTIALDLQGFSAQLTSQLYGQQSGTLALTGTVDWQNDISGSVSAVGHDFLVSPEPNIKLTLSPNLTLDYHNKKATVAGQLSVPFGRVNIKSLPKGAIRPSDDQIIIDEPISTVSHSPIDYSIDLDVIVQDDFRVKAMGLDSYITGEIELTKQPEKPLLASGELLLREGKYKALGQDLQIQTGQIGFNGPLDKPYLNIRAIRNPATTANDVIAGVELGGSISKPGLVIFTQPAMDQAHALAYLLNGQPLGEGSSSNSSMLTQLILSQSIDRSKGFVSKVGEKIGFEDVNLSAKGSGENTKVEVSGYVTPNIQVTYRMGVFESLNEFAVRYRVFSKLYIEATNGLYDSIDLLYKFDWDE